MTLADTLIISLTMVSMSLAIVTAMLSVVLRRHSAAIGVFSGLLGLALALFAALSGHKSLPLLIGANIAVIGVLLWSTGAPARIWARHRTKGLPDIIRFVILKRHGALGFGRAYAAAVLGNHESASPALRGTHYSYEKEGFLLTAPVLNWPVRHTEELNALIWASVREHDTGSSYFAPDMSTLFEKVYNSLLPFSGQVTDQNIDRVLAVAGRYGISKARHVVEGDMPAEYLQALGAEPLGEVRSFWWER